MPIVPNWARPTAVLGLEIAIAQLEALCQGMGGPSLEQAATIARLKQALREVPLR